MVDFTTPNLCGASEEFNKLVSQFDSIKESLKGQLEAEIDTVKSDVGGLLAVLEADMKGLIPELPSIPDVSFISEIQNLASLPAGSFSSLSALANIQSQFGDALFGAGFSLDSLVSDAKAAFSGGIDLCGGGLPNFVIGPDGLPTLKTDDVGMPDSDPVDEDGATLTTPAAEISSVNAPINLDVSVAAEKIQGAIANIQVVIASESGFISNKTIFAYDEADVVAKTAAIKAKTTATPQSTKVKDAVLTNKTLPPKTPAIKLTGEAAVEMESLKVLQDEVAEFENELIGEYERLSHLLLKYKQKSPHNLTADAKRQIVFDKKTKLAPARFLGSSLGGKKDINQFYKFYQTQITRAKLKIEDINDQITKRIDFIQGGLLTSITTEIDGETIIRRIIAADKEQSINDRFVAYKKNDGDELIKSMDIAYEEAEKTFSIPRR